MWWKAITIAWTVGRALWRHREALERLDRHERRRVAGEAVRSAELSARLIGAQKRYPSLRG